MAELDGQDWIIEMVNNIVIEVLSSIAEQERATIRKRQAEGIEAAKAKGQKFGRPAFKLPDNWIEIYSKWNNGELKAKEAMQLVGVKKTIFYKYVKIYEQDMKWSILEAPFYLKYTNVTSFYCVKK